jgi:phosphoglycerate dehydrogenase-like enzyme
MPVIALTHPESELPRFFAPEDLARLRAVAELRVAGRPGEPGFAPAVAAADILLGSWGMPRLDPAFLAGAPRLRAVCYAAGSVKGFVTDASYARGITVTTAMHANAVPVAEVTLALVILAGKQWFRCQDLIRAHGRAGFDLAHAVDHSGNFAITVGLVGFGAIARLVQERLRALDVRTLVHDPHAGEAAIRAAGAEPATLDQLARGCEVVSVHAPDIDATAGMFGAAFFAAMKDGAAFINTARGRLVDEPALIAALRGGRIHAYLDVTHPEPPAADSELYRLPNCWLTPHRAGSSAGEIRRMGRLAVDEALRVLAGEPPRHAVSQAQLATMA